ncbi:MATE family efflux transporter [Neobacillus pocheonensis]|uniref:MATE family efflux transporter n=1 Tax=Neobacillus pocheonensis TaxID=363869 RepID=A0ABT0WHN7_9BACI|nr:MATE family efflux transporter [Neobacillus pocheonensis]
MLTYIFFLENIQISNLRSNLLKKYIKELIGNGIKFFFLETSAVIIFATDSMVITHVVGSEGVTIYQLVMKLFSIFTTVSGTIMVPLWSAFTHAYSKGDIAWIKKIMRKILLMVIPLVSGVIVFTFLVNPILKIWIGNGIIAPKILICTIALYIIINIWSNIFAYFLNGVNKINGQLLTVGIGAVVNIPLSLFFSKTVGLGTVGVVLGTILSLLPFSILGPINTYLVIKRASK